MLTFVSRQRTLNFNNFNRFIFRKKNWKFINNMIEFKFDMSKFKMKNLDDVSKISNNVVSNDNKHEQQNVLIIDNAIVQRQFENITIVF